MKRLVIVLVILLAFSMSAYAQMNEGMKHEQQGQMRHGMMGEAQQMCPCPMREQMMGGGMMSMMQHMMGHNMMMRDMMQMMVDMMRIQKSMIKGLKTPEVKEMMAEIDKMMDRMDKMMSDMRGMMMKGVMGHDTPNPNKEDQKKDALAKESPNAEPHKH